MTPLFILAALAFLFWIMGWTHYLSLDAFVAHREKVAAYVAAHWLFSLSAMFLAYVIVVALSLPGALVLTIISGFLFGGLVGAALAAVAATLGATLLFLVARGSLGEIIRDCAGANVERFACGFRADAFNYLLFLRLVPVAPFWLVNLAPACLGVRIGQFVAATAIGILPSTLAFAFLGAGLDAAVSAHEVRVANCPPGEICNPHFTVHDLATPQLFMTMIALAALSLIPLVLRRWRKTPA